MSLYHTPNRVYGDFVVYQLPNTDRVVVAADAAGLQLGVTPPTSGTPLVASGTIKLRAGYWSGQAEYTDAGWYHVPIDTNGTSKFSLQFDGLERFLITSVGELQTAAGLRVTTASPDAYASFGATQLYITNDASTVTSYVDLVTGATSQVAGVFGTILQRTTDTEAALSVSGYAGDSVTLVTDGLGPRIDFNGENPLRFSYNNTEIASLSSAGVLTVTDLILPSGADIVAEEYRLVGDAVFRRYNDVNGTFELYSSGDANITVDGTQLWLDVASGSGSIRANANILHVGHSSDGIEDTPGYEATLDAHARTAAGSGTAFAHITFRKETDASGHLGIRAGIVAVSYGQETHKLSTVDGGARISFGPFSSYEESVGAGWVGLRDSFLTLCPQGGVDGATVRIGDADVSSNYADFTLYSRFEINAYNGVQIVTRAFEGSALHLITADGVPVPVGDAFGMDIHVKDSAGADIGMWHSSVLNSDDTQNGLLYCLYNQDHTTEAGEVRFHNNRIEFVHDRADAYNKLPQSIQPAGMQYIHVPGVRATGSIECAGTSEDGDTVTVGGVVFTARDTPTLPTEFATSAGGIDAADKLRPVLEAYAVANQLPWRTALTYDAFCQLVWWPYGVAGNDCTLETSAPGVFNVSGPTLTGGVDPTRRLDFDAGLGDTEFTSITITDSDPLKRGSFRIGTSPSGSVGVAILSGPDIGISSTGGANHLHLFGDGNCDVGDLDAEGSGLKLDFHIKNSSGEWMSDLVHIVGVNLTDSTDGGGGLTIGRGSSGIVIDTTTNGESVLLIGASNADWTNGIIPRLRHVEGTGVLDVLAQNGVALSGVGGQLGPTLQTDPLNSLLLQITPPGTPGANGGQGVVVRGQYVESKITVDGDNYSAGLEVKEILAGNSGALGFTVQGLSGNLLAQLTAYDGNADNRSSTLFLSSYVDGTGTSPYLYIRAGLDGSTTPADQVTMLANRKLRIEALSLEASTDVELTTAATGIILKSPNGTRYKIAVDDDGVITSVLA